MNEPCEVADEEHEQIVSRVAAVDVAKASGMVCTRVPHDTKAGRRLSKVWNVPATTNAVTELADHLVCQGIERVVLESTSDYWRIWFYLLEARGVTVWLVNANQVKQVPGRPKTDKFDAVWLAKLAERGMLRPSFVPPPEIRALRDYTRLSVDVTNDRSRVRLRMEKLLEDALIKLSTVATDIFGVSGRAMIEALIGGERSPRRLAALAKGRMRVKQAALVEALTGRFDAHHAYLARMLTSRSCRAEFSRTQVLDRPACGQVLFEEVIRENLDLGRPDKVGLVFDRQIRTRGRRRTRAGSVPGYSPPGSPRADPEPACGPQALQDQTVLQGRPRAAHRDDHQRHRRLRHRPPAVQPARPGAGRLHRQPASARRRTSHR